VAATRWDQFQKQAGFLEAAPLGTYWPGHAACHAFLNGLPRVVAAPLEGPPDEPASWTRALTRVLGAFPVAALVAPGLRSPAAQQALIDTFLSAGARGGTLWLDGPAGATPAALVAHRRALRPEDPRVRCVGPDVPTLTPGRRVLERVPATCLVAALGLGVTPALRGAHAPEWTPKAGQLDLIAGVPVDLLVPRGRRKLVALAAGLAGADITPAVVPAPPPLTLEAVVSQTLEAALLTLEASTLRGVALAKAAERNARGALTRLVERGLITRFRVEADPPDARSSVEGLALQVWISTPKRVRHFTLRMQPNQPP
jgi:hypothetical protein